MAQKWGKAGLGFAGGRGGWGVGLHRDEGLLIFFLEVSDYGIDSMSGKSVIIIEVVFSCQSMYVEAFYCVEVDAFFLELEHSHDVLHAAKGM